MQSAYSDFLFLLVFFLNSTEMCTKFIFFTFISTTFHVITCIWLVKRRCKSDMRYCVHCLNMVSLILYPLFKLNHLKKATTNMMDITLYQSKLNHSFTLLSVEISVSSYSKIHLFPKQVPAGQILGYHLT